MKLPAYFLLTFMALGAAMGIYNAPAYTTDFEKVFNEALPLYQPSRSAWGMAEYALFGQGRKGVVVGQEGWLFTDEEFACPRGWRTTLGRNLNYISDVRRSMAAQGIPLRILVIPAKLRAYPQFPLTACRQGLYEAGLLASGSGIDLLALMQAQPAQTFMRTDTHWSPAGAIVAAGAIARSAPELPHTGFEWILKDVIPFTGDLSRYLPGVAVAPEELVEASVSNPSASLLDDEAPPVVLVGTSYSANPQWGFTDALRFSLKADVLNKADAGLGPFRVMQNYLNDKSWQTTPPKLLIWEIPERYLVLEP